MKTLLTSLIILFLLMKSQVLFSQAIIIDHNCAKLDSIPESAILQAKSDLHIAYWHTSHGSQLTEGMKSLRDLDLTNLVGYKGDIYNWNDGGTDGALDLDDNYEGDLGHNGDLGWETTTRTYLADPTNSDVNVIIWSWCGGASDNTEAGMNIYLNAMNQLEIDFPNIKFIYMTGHLDGTGESGNLHVMNEQIRNYCLNNHKILYDFADIESYDPDGNYYLDKIANDNCDYDSEGNGTRNANWATAWQNSHTEGTDWYSCSAAHSQALNGNLKAYAAWWLWAKLAGWENEVISNVEQEQFGQNISDLKNYPNPFDSNTTIVYNLKENAHVKLELWNASGQKIKVLLDQKQTKGKYSLPVNIDNKKGVYFYTLNVNGKQISNKMLKLK